MNRTEMIKWLSENTTREQWMNHGTLFFTGDLPPNIKYAWVTSSAGQHCMNGKVIVRPLGSVDNNDIIRINDVFDIAPVTEQPVYIDGAVYEIGLMNKEPQQFVYNCKLNMFERGTNESIGASNVHESKVVTHFKLVSEPERITDRETYSNLFKPSTESLVQPQLSEDTEVFFNDVPLSRINNCKPTYSAVSMLNEAVECIGDRAAERDADSERSMLAAVNAFNAMYGTELTETQGWMFMVFLKASRAKGGDFREDDYVDGASYFALAGECDGNVRR